MSQPVCFASSYGILRGKYHRQDSKLYRLCSIIFFGLFHKNLPAPIAAKEKDLSLVFVRQCQVLFQLYSANRIYRHTQFSEKDLYMVIRSSKLKKNSGIEIQIPFWLTRLNERRFNILTIFRQSFLTSVFLGSFELPNFIVMSYPSTEIICGSCGTTILRIINLRPIRDILRSYDGKCKTCGNNLNPADFTIEIEKI
jgi:hypothetical protein